MPYLEWLRFRFFDPERYRRTEVPLAAFGRFWSGMIERGTRYLDALPQNRVLSLAYEAVLASPREELGRFIRFVGPEFENEGWLEEVTAMPRSKPPGWAKLPASELARLNEACAPGMALLGYETEARGSA